MVLTTPTKIGIFLFILLIVLLIVWLITYIIYVARKKKRRAKGPGHMELYFDENFRNIIDEWDLMPRSQIKSWKKDMNKKLKVINRDVKKLKDRKISINSRLNALEKEMGKLEEF